MPDSRLRSCPTEGLVYSVDECVLDMDVAQRGYFYFRFHRAPMDCVRPSSNVMRKNDLGHGSGQIETSGCLSTFKRAFTNSCFEQNSGREKARIESRMVLDDRAHSRSLVIVHGEG